ncbi:bifunctional [glutamine synthetase] adenylyltransferase/[glutamine synthetase]-adenylyl-L-tyrosine phosphorylase [Varunaivibrio sulfuroxidans]|uniref:Bifunctional glutamine synthetase adenylyltransferase/adenylyl-removing enzyme n=1 Tax=Varunaivibrio sulfuroxidans TaxID=1773489 RepID=A0A4R3J873_9PROT|nr:bifunctional [glutamine synthetase] adenylyltransferase/[glutamine synthetase]-adenylyl-L-tyrosine phosphorylase [Varunaivibrio sulfuroxidans]TCS62159.1 glutamate-ammonia-ligase adenylyltransferase [Varunaivibrio sulfuroxidans]WES30588.1 bifunctional [glutamine synthetase] adenylyltransferase/[glutamine synthetase]-adenylyl-L-tyrosine phosphorylase [Varunaivibrio sulfuroxidans]
MHNTPAKAIAFNPDLLPLPADGERARVGFERWRTALSETGLASSAAALEAERPLRRLLEVIFADSPFLTSCAIGDPHFSCDMLTRGPDHMIEAVLAPLRNPPPRDETFDSLSRRLRIAKRRVALITAIADITAIWPLEKVTDTLSSFAALALDSACAHLLRTSAQKGAFALANEDDPVRGSGLIVLGMGKLGGRELNYSSDIDIIVLFDRERIHSENPDGLQKAFVRLTRNLVRLLDEHTAHGYVFRTDLRLRPDPGSTPLAISALAAETYYESIGQNWERAAMIKARPVAGDIEAGEAFLLHLKPFIWRKSLDFAAIEDIRSIKRQINAHKGGDKITLFGHNLKLGRGGIREIEFFAQTQQLIWGGREAGVRVRATVGAIFALVAHGRVARHSADTLVEAYRFLRRLEHRLQMIDDKQTHSLPETPDDMDKIARFMGYGDTAEFIARVLATLRAVEEIYASLFEESPALSSGGDFGGNLVFTGSESDPETLATLEGMGYAKTKTVDATVRGWHHGRYRATRSTRARELLTELMPSILGALAHTPDPDAAFVRFDAFLANLPSGVQLFSLFHSNPQLLEFIAEIMGTSPRLASYLSRKVSVLDSVLSHDFFAPPLEPDDLAKDLDNALLEALDLQDTLDVTRRWAKEKKFQIGVQSLRATITTEDAQKALTNIAETLIRALQSRLEDIFAERHGRLAGGALCVVAFGKLGGREKTPTSDLDLIFIYDVDAGVERSDGAHPLPPSLYYARLCQRLINALNVQTGEGKLYEIDMRLRPSGNDGPIASTLEGFLSYQKEQAWTWEHMALTRARPLSGPHALRDRVATGVRDILARERDPDKLVADVAHMRARMDKKHHTASIWNLKYLRGGLIDVEFITQYLQLRHAHAYPDILSPTTATALERIAAHALIAQPDAKTLLAALALWQNLQSMIRLGLTPRERDAKDMTIPKALAKRLCALAGVKSLAHLETLIRDTARDVMAIYHVMVTQPAQHVGGAQDTGAPSAPPPSPP